MAYNIFLYIHIISYILWLAAFVGSLIFYQKVKSNEGTPDEKKFARKERMITMMGGHTAILGILISGGAMVSIPSGPQWGWFPFHEYGWLATKQIIFIIILIIVFGLSTPAGSKLKKMIRKNDQDTFTVEQRKQWHKVWTYSFIAYLLVVVNTYLGLFRP